MADEKNSNNDLPVDLSPGNTDVQVLETPPVPPTIEIKELDNEPPLSGKLSNGERVATTALSKKQEKDLAEARVKSMIKDIAPRAVGTIIDIMCDTSVKDETRLKAAQDILDRGLGKAKQTVDNELKGGIQIKLSPALEEFSE